MLSRAILRAPTTVSTAAVVCASADPFRVPECSNATVSIPPPKSVCFSSRRSRAAALPNNGVGFVRQDNQFQIDLLVPDRSTSSYHGMPTRTPRQIRPKSQTAEQALPMSKVAASPLRQVRGAKCNRNVKAACL